MSAEQVSTMAAALVSNIVAMSLRRNDCGARGIVAEGNGYKRSAALVENRKRRLTRRAAIAHTRALDRKALGELTMRTNRTIRWLLLCVWMVATPALAQQQPANIGSFFDSFTAEWVR